MCGLKGLFRCVWFERDILNVCGLNGDILNVCGLKGKF